MKKQFMKSLDILPGVLILLGIGLTRLHGYLLFHGLAEMFSITIAFVIFIVAWNSRRFHDDNYFLFIGVAYVFIGVLDLIHTLAYRGMGVFPGHDADLSIQLWLAARYIESISLFLAPLFYNRKLHPRVLFSVYTAVISFLLLAIFYWRLFPHGYIEGVGLTPFKKISEYIISLILAAAVVSLLRKRSEFNADILRLLAVSIILTIASELAFTCYRDVYGLFNMAGHLLKIVSFYLVYKAIVETALEKPYDLLFRKLKQHEESLEKAKEAAEHASRAKSKFLANMSHELRTPLNGILGYAQILKRGSSSSQQQRDGLDIIERSGNHLLTLINDVLDLSKIEAGKVELSQNNFHLPTFLENICDIIRPSAEDKGIFFRFQSFDFSRDRPGHPLPSFIRGDEKRLRQVLINLLNNAVKFTGGGGVTFKVGPVDKKGRETPAQIRFQVEDTGNGIAGEHLAAIFDPFHQVGDSGRGEGTGLGLTISRNFIQMMGGDLHVKSAPGQGSIFWFDLMMSEITGRSEAIEAPAPGTRRVGGAKGKKKHPDSPHTAPPPAEVAELYELSLMGDINELKARAAVLEQSDRRLKPFAMEIQRLIKGYRMNDITKLLETYLERAGGGPTNDG